MIVFPAARFKRERGLIVLEEPEPFRAHSEAFFSRLTAGYVRAQFAMPGKPRSTGAESQNHHINGHCQQIAAETGTEFGAVKEYMKRLCVEQGRAWKFTSLPDGTICPGSEANATVDEASALIENIHQWAAEWNIELIEETP
jgi:hypothetical protein